MKKSKERVWDVVAASFCAGMALFIIYLTHTTFVEADVSTGGPFANSAFYPRLVAFVIVSLLLDRFGYLIVTPFFMVVLFWLLRIRKWITVLLLSVISTVALYLFFSTVLEVILPPGRYSLIWW